MKKLNNYNYALLMVVVLMAVGCEEELTPNEQTEKLLTAATWNLQSVKIDGVASNLYANLGLTFSKGNYSATNGGVIFGSSGTWSFNGTDGKAITVGSGLSVEVTTITSTGLTLTFTWDKTTLDKGRSGSLKGQHVMVFTGS